MRGWMISVARQSNGGLEPAVVGSDVGSDIAVWQTGVGGLGWLDKLVSQGLVVSLGGNGYPFSYTAKAEFIRPEIDGGPPHAKGTWTTDRDSAVDWDRWAGRTAV